MRVNCEIGYSKLKHNSSTTQVVSNGVQAQLRGSSVQECVQSIEGVTNDVSQVVNEVHSNLLVKPGGAATLT